MSVNGPEIFSSFAMDLLLWPCFMDRNELDIFLTVKRVVSKYPTWRLSFHFSQDCFSLRRETFKKKTTNLTKSANRYLPDAKTSQKRALP